MAILPLSTSFRGPAPPPSDDSAQDIVAEAITLFRANSLFRNYEIHGAADRVLVYIILFIGDCLSQMASPAAKSWTVNEANKQLQSHAVDTFALPGEPGFPINAMYDAPANRQDAGRSKSLTFYLAGSDTVLDRHDALLPHASTPRDCQQAHSNRVR